MIQSEKAQRVAEITKSALDRAGAERATFLDEACAGDAEMRAEVDSFLQFQDEASQFIEQGALHVAAETLARDPALPALRQIEGYEIISRIGVGGMGEVYLAQDTKLRREVALKLVRAGMDSVEIVARFRHEEQILASLNHTNIAQLYGAGVAAGDVPFFAMEFIEGVRIDEYCNVRALSITARLQLFRKVCAAVHYAHQHLVIHRDLKPSNILVTADGEPKLLDFGIAKLVEGQDAFTQVQTLAGVMTPDYASPEQVRGEAITTSSDVYSLGVLLYEILTGQRPYRLKSRSPNEISRAITDQEPERPSTAIARAENSKLEIRNSKFPKGDLDNIVLMALRKEPSRRYASVGQFSEDIRRYLEGLPVLAHKDILSYRATKFIKRNKIGVAATSLIALTLLGGIIATSWQARIATAERDQARIEKANAERVSAFLQNVLLLADPSWIGTGSTRGHELTADRLLETAAGRARKDLTDQPVVLAGVLRSIGNTYRSQGNYVQAEKTLREARDILIRMHSAQDYDAMNVSYNLAQCLMLAGKYSEADRLCGAAVAFFRERVDRADDAQVAVLAGLLNDFGFLLRCEGKPAAAEARLLEAMEFAPRWKGAARALVGIHLCHLGLARDDQGDLAGAEKYEREAIAELRRLPGGDRMELGTALGNLGHVLTTKGDYANAESAIRDSLSIYHRLLGDAHPYVALGLDRLARVQFLQGDHDGAQRSAEQSIAIQNVKLPGEHPQRAYPLTALGIVLTHSGHAPEAESHLLRALSLREKTLPQNHWLVAETKFALGESLSAQDKPAESILVAGYEGLKASLGPGHPRTLAAAQISAKFYEDSGHPELAVRYRAQP